MTVVRIQPGTANGVVRCPPSKSYTHRALVVGHLSGRSFRIRNPLDSDDTRATADALVSLGTSVDRRTHEWKLRPSSRARPAPGRQTINCRDSGTTLRFASALAALGDRPVALTGSPRLSERPIDDLLRTLRELGARARHLRASALPLEIQGPLHSGRVSLDSSKSSQFASALLLVLPALAGDSMLTLRGRLVSWPYVESTLAILHQQGVRVSRRGRVFHVPGSQRILQSEFRVPGDASSAAYLWAAAAISGGTVRVRGLPMTWPQADLAVLSLLRSAGADVTYHVDGATVSANRRVPFRVDLTNAPDLYPLAGVLAATTPGPSRIEGADHVVLKESDRRAETATLAERFGAGVRSTKRGLEIRGTPHPRPLHALRMKDHRLVMSAAVGALGGDRPSSIGDRDSVSKSFPGFWEALESLSRGTVSA
ncbi:MAG TPA: 3-phosphoshikimate 1-carboxyvinyltransferase [Thermoplasmata archaeon]|nr:3-phosphoshikimate 1-carboxyvinyltransferase [Thermoplasmata archaeon]